MLKVPFQVTVNGTTDVRKYALQKSPINITYSIEYEEHEARIFSGLSAEQYEQLPGTMDWCTDQQPLSKSEVLAVWRLHKLINAVREQASRKKGQR